MPVLTTHRLLAVASIALFATSLALPAFRCDHGQPMPGLNVLLTGWMGLLGLDPRWFANIGALLLVTRALGHCPPSPKTAGVTALLALFSFAPAAGCGAGGGSLETTSGLAAGGYIWIVAMLLSATAGMLGTPETPPQSDSQDEHPTIPGNGLTDHLD